MSSKQRIAVIGAGVVGLSTAVQIQEALPSSHVTIIANRFNQETTSDGAAGIFRPNGEVVPGVQMDLLRQWTKDSFAFYHELAHSPEASNAGVGVLDAYHFFIEGEEEKDSIYKEFIYDYRPCTGAEYKIYPHTDKAHSAFRYTTLIVEGRWFLPWLMKRFEEKGGRVEKRKLKSLEELIGRFDIVVNCTGLGSFDLLGDKKMVPNRGQVIRVKAPWLKHSLMVDDDIYIIPGRDTVVVGGTRQQGDGDLNVRAADRDRIWERACKYVPSLKNAKWEWEWVGLRPYRNPLRLEKEIVRFQKGSLPVVHNYGHSGEGMGLAWGTGKHACRLVCELVTTLAPSTAKL